MPVIAQVRTPLRWMGFCLALFAGALPVNSAEVVLTNLAQLRAQDSSAGSVIRLEGDIWWANPAANQLVLHDDSGADKLELNLQGQSVKAGERIVLEGCGIVMRRGDGFRLGLVGPVLDVNGMYAMEEKSATVYLQAGRQPLRVDWFNKTVPLGLEVEWAGPGLPRHKISSGELFQSETNQANGLHFLTCDAFDEVLPDFENQKPITTGIVSNFDLSIMPRRDHIGVRFTGALMVPCDGVYTFYVRSDDGCQLFVRSPVPKVTVLGQAQLPLPQKISPGQKCDGTSHLSWAQVEGIVTFASEVQSGLECEITSDSGRMRVQLPNAGNLSSAQLLGKRIRATGVCECVQSAHGQWLAGALLLSASGQIEILGAAAENGADKPPNLRVLRSAVEVHQLKREEAERGYPAKLRGVVTSLTPERHAFTLQDATRGIYVENNSTTRSGLPGVGDLMEVAGTTDPGLFAPIVRGVELKDLGAGRMPEPIHPTWDQLLNGSLDAQYVELLGIIASVSSNTVTLFTRDGRINVGLRPTEVSADFLSRNKGASVRIRGCLKANWDWVTHKVSVGSVRISNPAISVDKPAPADVLAMPGKSIADLLLFDPRASGLERVKISGQLVHWHGSEGYLSDGTNALRFHAQRPVNMAVGDLLDVVGFVDLGGLEPELREAVFRKTGHTALPEPTMLTPDKLGLVDFDATYVRVQGGLVSSRQTRLEWILEMQSGLRTFVARFPGGDDSVGSIAAGSQLELTGLYNSLGANKSSGERVSAFELLLNSSADIHVLARPPWWTLKRLLIMVGLLFAALAGTALWITQLHRKVEQRSAELTAQIQERQRIEQQHAMEQERARVAQDLHDDLGSGLTEISMLGARAQASAATEERRKDLLKGMADKAREMVVALDEIVWAMNPQHDSLSSLVSYFCLHADRFLGLANIRWELERTSLPENFNLDSRSRHQLFLAFKEALTNIVHHAQATRVQLSFKQEANELRLNIADNGRGLPQELPDHSMDGIANMRRRLENIGGRCEIESQAGSGTTVRLILAARK